MRTEREVREIRGTFDARLAEVRLAAIESKKLLHDQIEILQAQIVGLKDELRRAQLAGQDVLNSTFAAFRVPPPHPRAKPDGEPRSIRPVGGIKSWDEARIELERREAEPAKEDAS